MSTLTADDSAWLRTRQAEVINAECQNHLDARLPHRVYQPKLSRDGNMWCALFGDNLQEGVSGFGKTPRQAMAAFDHAWDQAHGASTYGVNLARF